MIRLGYVQQKKEEDSEKIILNLHMLVRVAAKKVLPIEEKQADAFLEGMPLPYRKYEMENLWMASIAESYVQAREVVGKGNISVWLLVQLCISVALRCKKNAR